MMGGTKQGGLKAASTNKQRYGNNFYVDIGRAGGKLGRTGGFYANRELARTAGAKGGKISKRSPAKPKIIVITPPRRFWDIRRKV